MLSLRLLLSLSLLLVAGGCGNEGRNPMAKPAAGKPAAVEPANGNSITPQSVNATLEPSRTAGTKYVPRVSEKKLQDFLDGLDDSAANAVTDEQVFAVMGEPTRRGAPVTGKKNGQPLTVYEVFWEEPGSGIKSNAGFMNGRLSGMALGIEIPKR